MRIFSLSISLFVFLFVGQVFGNLQCSHPNEIQDCVKECPPEKSCGNKDIKFNCLVNNKRCQIKCVCKEGFYRNYDGDCVSDEACDRCPAPNEVFSCGSACDTTCATLNQQCPIVNIKCNDKCYCRRGYARNDKNICILMSECISEANNTLNSHENVRKARAAYQNKENANVVCGPNEEYQECKKTCPPDTCMSLVARFKCASNPPCTPGCVCQPNFLRTKRNSPCMPMRQCPELAHSPDFN
ncbi:inducible metalloproteinase inhibitor protein isoform X1 [Maniola jurtina]|uniref:inducible metalloproteinase inhibitor protein isoform X1 n=1 Tax=Maniola jurtina TaxID=191418 RepID=UPI001E68729C|nr:inducible metalloproteinase inhibitor protein isoform X1 [Maniola jurtina]